MSGPSRAVTFSGGLVSVGLHPRLLTVHRFAVARIAQTRAASIHGPDRGRASVTAGRFASGGEFGPPPPIDQADTVSLDKRKNIG